MVLYFDMDYTIVYNHTLIYLMHFIHYVIQILIRFLELIVNTGDINGTPKLPNYTLCPIFKTTR